MPRQRRPRACSAPSPRAARSSTRASAGRTRYGTGKGEDTITSGLEGAWTPTPITWDNSYFETLFGYEWELDESPAGAKQWTPKDGDGAGRGARRPRPVAAARPDDADERPRAADGPGLRADLAALPWRTRTSSRWRVRQGLVQAAAPRHGAGVALPRPVGRPSRSCGRTRCPRSTTSWSTTRTSRRSRRTVLDSGLSVAQLVATAWASAASFRGTDKRGGANGARIRLAPQKDWEANEPAALATVLAALEGIQQDFNARASGGKRISLADLIVLAGGAAVEQAAKDGGHDVTVPFAPGRTDASQEQTDVESFAVLEPQADGFRNYLRAGEKLPPETLLLDRANLLDADRPGDDGAGRRYARARRQRRRQPRTACSPTGPGTLTNDFFVNLLDMGTEWRPSAVDRERLRGPRPGDGRAAVDGHGRRPRLRRRTRSCGPSPRSTPATTPRRSSSGTSWRRGSRS